MLKRTITYKDFNDNDVTETLYFRLSKPELMKLEAEHEGGLGGMLRGIFDKGDSAKAFLFFDDMLRRSYGEKSDDGKRHEKSEELSTNFVQTAAYEQLYEELVSSPEAAIAFLKGILPADMQKEIAEAEATQASLAKAAETVAGQAQPPTGTSF